MSERKTENFIIIKPEPSQEEKLKQQIEWDLFYLIECSHCEIVFLIEESTDTHKDSKHPDEILAKCPVCYTDNLHPKGQNRLKLRLEKIMKPNEINPYYERVAKKMQIEGFDY